MISLVNYQPDPTLDLWFERTIDIPPELVWKAWTQPEYIKQWFTPTPWSTIDCEIDLRPGGIFRTVMRSPEGETFPGTGCYLEIIENRKLVWTNVLKPGYRPAKIGTGPGEFAFTAVISLEPHRDGANYQALAIHADSETRQVHADMGFQQGWGAALDQLVALMKTPLGQDKERA